MTTRGSAVREEPADDPTARPAGPRARIGFGAAVVVVIVALGITVGIGILRGALAPVETVTGPGAELGGVVDASAGGAEQPLYVHVSGAVVVPGLYLLRGGDRVVDAVAAAGGFAPGADEQSVNLARVLSDGEQLVVPALGEPARDGSLPAVGDGRVNLNTADTSALDTLPRIGPAMAERIIQWRDENGRFTSVEDLLAVPGIGDRMLQTLRDLVTV